MPKKNKKKSAKDIFEKYIAREITGETSERTIEIFCSMDYNNFYNLAKKYKLEERQVSSLIGFKDEFLVKLLITQIISENGLDDIFYCKKDLQSHVHGDFLATFVVFQFKVLYLIIFNTIDRTIWCNFEYRKRIGLPF